MGTLMETDTSSIETIAPEEGATETPENETTKMSRYELAFLIVPLIAPESLEEEVSALRDALPGLIVSVSTPTMRPLAYPISKLMSKNKFNFGQAYFGSIIFEAPPSEVDGLIITLRKHANVLRAIITAVTVAEIAPVRGAPADPSAVGPSTEAAMEKEIDQLIESAA